MNLHILLPSIGEVRLEARHDGVEGFRMSLVLAYLVLGLAIGICVKVLFSAFEE